MGVTVSRLFISRFCHAVAKAPADIPEPHSMSMVIHTGEHHATAGARFQLCYSFSKLFMANNNADGNSNHAYRKGLDYVGVAVVYYCHDGRGNFVMSKRGKNSRDEQGRWDPGGGGVEFGIPILENLRNEIREEYGAEVLKHEFLGFRDVHRETEKGRTHWLALDFKVLVDPKQVKNNEPHKFDDVRWFTLDTLPSPVHSQIPEFIRLYDKKLRE